MYIIYTGCACALNFKEDIVMTIKPLADRVVIKMVEAEETTKSGIIPVSYTHLTLPTNREVLS